MTYEPTAYYEIYMKNKNEDHGNYLSRSWKTTSAYEAHLFSSKADAAALKEAFEPYLDRDSSYKINLVSLVQSEQSELTDGEPKTAESGYLLKITGNTTSYVKSYFSHRYWVNDTENDFLREKIGDKKHAFQIATALKNYLNKNWTVEVHFTEITTI